jgi:Rps23 Pro-64 3,4-dihydroxylase Tpa1-like proline 4-hydroxylase
MPSTPSFSLNLALNVEALRAEFLIRHRLRIDNFLADDGAARLRDALASDGRWMYVINGRSTVFEIARSAYDAMPSDQRDVIDNAVLTAAAHDFQFRYETIRVPDEAEARIASATLLDQFALFMSAPETLSFIRAITDVEDVAFADAQATRYRPGDFLTRHDDNVQGKNRRLAYVFGLSQEWRAEWGGLLFFTDAQGEVIDTLIPRFNALSLFAVPQPHSVSFVAPCAPHPRMSVTGWLRNRGQPTAGS